MNLQNQIDFLRDIYKSDMFSECNSITIPAPLDPEMVRSSIVMRCGLLEPAYSEPSIMHQLTNLWFHTNAWNFQHLVNIILAEYSPIENTDRYSDHSTISSGTGSRAVVLSKDNEETHSGTDRRDIDRSGTDSTENTVSAYNASNYQADHKEDLTHGESVSDDLEHGHIINTAGHDRTEATDNSSDSENYTEHTHGNIGVTTNQEMINQELELLQKFNVYDWIAAKYERDLCLQIY